MKSFIHPSLSLSLLLLLTLLQHLSPATAASDPNIILKTCKQCSDSSPNVNYTLCVASLQSVPESYHSNLSSLDVISVMLAIAKGKQAQTKVKELLLKSKPKDQFRKSCLETCLDHYTDALSRLTDSVKAIKLGHYDDANIWISSAVDAPGNCDDSFAARNYVSPLVEEDKGFFQLVVISLAITAILE